MNLCHKKILLVEDDPAHVELILRAFQGRSDALNLTITRLLSEALDLVSHTPPDLVITDLVLPDGQGVELLKNGQFHPHYPVIVMTSFGDENIAVEAIKAGALDYIVKSEAAFADMPRIAERALREWDNMIRRRQAEEELKKSREFLYNIINAIDDPIFVKDEQHRWVILNNKHCEMIGRSRENLLGKSDNDVYPHDQARHFWATDDLVLDSGRTTINEEQVTWQKKTYTISTKKSLYLDSDTDRKFIVGSIRDISERKFMEEALRQSENLLRTVINATQDAMISIDQNGLITLFNPAAEKIFGRSAADMIGQPLDQLIPPLYRDKHPQYVRDYFAGGKPDGAIGKTLELPALHSNGHIFPMEISLSAGHLDHKHFVIAVARDITQRKQAEDALRKSEERFRAIFETARDAIFIKDRSLRYTHVNLSMEKLFGLPAEQFIGHSDVELFDHETDGPEPLNDDRILHGEIVEEEYTKSVRGVPTTLDIIKVPMRNAQDRIIGLCGIARDITERKRTQEEREKAIAEKTAIYDTMNEGLIMADLHGRIITFNRAMREIWNREGLPVENLTGKTVRELPFFIPEDALCFSRALRELLRTGKTELLNLQTASTRWCSITFALLRHKNNQPHAILAVVRDITAQRKARQALQDTNEMLERIFSTTYLSIAYLDTKFNFIRVNRAYAEAAAREPRYFVDKNYFDLFPQHHAKTVFKRVVQSGRAFTANEHAPFQTEHPQFGHTFWDWTLQPVRDSSGRVEGLLLCLINITERKQAREKLIAYQEQLRSLASELSLTEERERRRIAADLHDSIGQTLAFIQIKLEMLRQDARHIGLAAELEEIRNLIQKTIQETQSLMFELSPPVLHELGFGAALEWLVEQIQSRHNLRCLLKNEGIPENKLNTDYSVVLFRAVRELLINVVKHARAQWARVSLRQKNHTLWIAVEDNGKGFDPSRITAHNTRSGGYGLFNIRERLEHFGGHLKINSKPKRGTQVILTLPLTTSP